MSDNPFSVANSPRSGGQNPFSVGYKPISQQQHLQGQFLPGLLKMLQNVGGSFQGMLGNATNSFNNFSQGFTNWQNKNNPNRTGITTLNPEEEEKEPWEAEAFKTLNPEPWQVNPAIDTNWNVDKSSILSGMMNKAGY